MDELLAVLSSLKNCGDKKVCSSYIFTFFGFLQSFSNDSPLNLLMAHQLIMGCVRAGKQERSDSSSVWSAKLKEVMKTVNSCFAISPYCTSVRDHESSLMFFLRILVGKSYSSITTVDT